MNPRPRPNPRDPVQFIAIGFGAGLAPHAPGTFGTLVAIPLYLLLATQPMWIYALVTLVVVAIGIPLCGIAARRMGVHDHPAIVWDEIAGYLLTMLAAPDGWPWLLAGFALFRLFDITKPWPVRIADQRVHGGLGIMLDDVLAAGYAWLCLQALVLVSGSP